MSLRRTAAAAPSGSSAAVRQKLFSMMCASVGLPVPVEEYRFAPPRRWRFDYAWPTYLLALEVQGGIFTQGRHTRGPALLKEHEKLNAAAMLGWRVLFVTPSKLMTDGLSMVEQAMGTEAR